MKMKNWIKTTFYTLILLFLSACSSHITNKREISSLDRRSHHEAEQAYWNKRGRDWAKFSYDGYSGKRNKLKFLRATSSPKNIAFSLELSKRRQELFDVNLFDTGVSENADLDCSQVMKRVHRTPYGECYFYNIEDNLSDRDKTLANQLRMGALNERFGRNITATDENKAAQLDLMTPSPLEISEKLMSRNGEQIDAPVINVLATAWLQAMNHDWFSHGKNSKEKSYKLDPHHSHPHFKEGMSIPATAEESEEEKSLPKHGYEKTFRNKVTHWWDASQIYGSEPETIRKVRSVWRDGESRGELIPEGKIAVDVANRRLRYDSEGLPITGFHDNWWTGLELVHTLFHLEHNSIINRILKPLIAKGELCYENGQRISQSDCDDILFEKARMINSALMAKIHTVEWTPALLDNEMLHIGMRSNWFGMREVSGISTPWLRGQVDGGIKHLISGLVGEKTLDLYSVPFTLTEEFVAVYRMHPLIPDNVTIRDARTGRVGKEESTFDMIFRKAQAKMADYDSATWLNSFGTSFPGAMTLHNYPTWMKNFKAERNTGSKHEDAAQMDMAAVDIFRDRERGVPRYNDFRRALNLPAINSFEELTPNEKSQELLHEVYDGDIESMDLLVGTLAESDRYPGYAFGNTPFYIFALMASRRLMADPFFSDYYTPEYYTKDGLDHVQKTTMIDVIVRHFPELRNRFYEDKTIVPGQTQVVENAFRPWLPVYKDVKEAIKDMDSL
jgi:hypothetical protein